MTIDYPERYVKTVGQYLLKNVDEFYLTNIEQDLSNNSIEEIVDKYLNTLDCTRYDKDHKFRIMQTIGFPYQLELSKLVYFVSKYGDTDEVYEHIKTRHENNIRFEFENPPIIYSDKKLTKFKTVKQKRTKKTESKPKQTKEEKKVAKINAKFATFNIPKIKL